MKLLHEAGNMHNDWVEFKRSFNQDQEDAIWQFFLDHSRTQPSGAFLIAITIEDMNDFWKRVHARHAGLFKRADKLQKETNQRSAFARYFRLQKQVHETRLNRVLFYIYKKIHYRLFGPVIEKH